jgi:hypothetical protein
MSPLQLLKISRSLAERLDELQGITRVDLAPDQPQRGLVSYVVTNDQISKIDALLRAQGDADAIREWESATSSIPPAWLTTGEIDTLHHERSLEDPREL